MEIIRKSIDRLGRKALQIVVLVALTLAAFGVWLFLHDRPTLDRERRLRVERAGVQAKIDAVQRRMDGLAGLIPAAKDRADRAGKVVGELKQLQSTWDWFAGHHEQQKANQERLAKMEALQTEAASRVADLREELRRTKWERDGQEIDRDRLDARLRTEEAKKSTVTYYLRRAWLRARSWIVLGLAIYLAGPVMISMAWARWRRRRRTG